MPSIISLDESIAAGAAEGAGQPLHVDLLSSAISALDWDPQSGELMVTFKAGNQATYPSVPEQVFRGFAAAASPGSYYNVNVKGQF